ncbi:MAG: hypothetical protein ABIV05_06645 [Actinomycetota bacterium]
MTIDGTHADVDVELVDWATCTVSTALSGRVEVLARDRASVDARAGAITLSGSARARVGSSAPDEHGDELSVRVDQPTDVVVAASAAVRDRVADGVADSGPGVQLIDVLDLRQVPRWLWFHHRDPDPISPPGRVRVFVTTSAKPGHEGATLGPGNNDREPAVPGSSVPPGVALPHAAAWPMALHPGTPAVVVALDVLATDCTPDPWLMGTTLVRTTVPCPVTAVDPFDLPPYPHLPRA